MSQVTNYTVENAGGATVRADINNILLAVQSNNSGVTAPSLTYAGMLWLETPVSGNYTLKVRDKGNNHWLTVGIVTDPDDDDDMGVRLLQGAASKTHIKRSDGTVLLAEDGSNVATLTNVVLGTGSEPTSTPLLEMAATSTGIKRSSGTALLTEDGSNVATLDQLTLGPGSGATNLKMAAVKLTADGRLERSDGADILLEGSGVATLDNVSLGSSVTGRVMVQSKCYLITGPVTVPDGSAARTDLLTMAFTKTHDASTSKLIFQGAGRIFNNVGASQSWVCHMFTKVDTTYTAAPVTTSHGTPPAGVFAAVYRLNDGQSTPFRTSTGATLGPFETTDYADGTFSFVLSHYRDGYDAITVDWFCAQITEIMI